MAITVTIAGVDKSSGIDWATLTVEQVVTSQVDAATFSLMVHAGKTYRPAIGDTITIDDGATRIFGGTIVRIDDSIEGGLLTRLSVSCVSHERTLDRFLVVREFTSVSARYMLNGIIDEFVNQPGKEIDLGESTETWVQEDGTLAANTTAGQFIQGSQSEKLTATSSSTATARRANTLDLTKFSDASVSTTADKIKICAYVANVANVASIRIRFVSDSGATYTNYFEATVLAASLVTGWNEIIIAKSAFSSTGSPSWANCLKRQYRVTASAAGTAIVSIDDVRLISSGAFTMANVKDADFPTNGSAKFNYEQATSAIKQIAEMMGNDWYIDADKDLHFFAPSTEQAPFALTDTSANFNWNSLEFNTDSALIKNTIIVRGGEYQGNSDNFDKIADGTQLNFVSPYKIKNISVTVGGSGKTVGVDNLNDPASYDCLYNFQEKTLKFKSATLPSAGQVVRMTGNPMIPVIVKRGDPTSIAANGIYEFLIIDKSINTQQAARDRASAELFAYRNSLVEGKFTTDTTGLRAGQTLGVTITARGINETYVIQSIYFRTKSPTEFVYDVKLVSTRSFGVIEYLLGLLRDQKKTIVISDSEVIDLVQDIVETITPTDSWSQGTQDSSAETMTLNESPNDGLNQGTIFVLAPYVPSGFSDTKRPFILNGSPLG